MNCGIAWWSIKTTTAGAEWLAQLAEMAPAAASARHAEREVIREIAQRLGSVDDLGFPYAREALAQTSTAWLERTSDLANVLLGRHEEFAGLIGHLVARDVPGAWPTRVSVRWLADQFRGTPLLEGLSLDMGPLPKTLGAASFVRALARFGAAYARVAVIAPGRAFAFTHEPWGAHPLRRGALFGSLVADPAFLQKQLGFSKDDARRTGRALAATLLAQTRLDAAQSLLDLASASAAAGQEAIEYALKVRVAEGLSAVLPKPAVLAPVRFAAALLAAGDRDDLRDRFDDDWFRNPRALFSLREFDAAPKTLEPPSKEPFAGAVDRMARYIEELAS